MTSPPDRLIRVISQFKKRALQINLFSLYPLDSKRAPLILILVFIFCWIGSLTPSAWASPKEPTSPLLEKSPEERREPIHITADRLEYRKEENVYIAEGAVAVEQGPLRLEADFLRLNNTTGKLFAKGNVHFADGKNTIDAEQVEIDVNTQLGILYNGRLFIESDHYYLEGEEIERRALDRYSLKEASFTACDCPEDPDWRIRARRIRVQLENYLIARDIVFYAGEIPILYLPYFIYPVKTERQTGLLVPRLGYSTRHGFRYNQEFFWAIAQNQDATFSADYRGNKGEGGGLEYRYVLSKESRGQLEADYFYDEQNRIGRWEIRYHHQQRFTERIDAKLDLRYINQENNLLELSDETDERAQQHIESNLFITYRGEESFAYLLARYTQNLTIQSNDTTLQRLPEVGYSLIEHRLGNSPLFFNFDSTAIHFWREEGLKAERIDLYPKISWPIPLTGAATLTPWAGFRETWYSRGTVEDEPLRRNVFPMGIDLEGRFYSPWGEATHLIIPSLMYEYIAAGDRNDIPQFDEVDQIHDRHSVTLSLAQRFLQYDERGERIEKVTFRWTETYNIHEARADLGDPRPYSDLRLEWAFRLFSYLSLDVDSFYNWTHRNFGAWNTDLNLDLRPHISFSLGQRFTREGLIPQKGDLFNPLFLGDREPAPPIQFWTERLLIKTPWGISLISRAYYNVNEKKFVEIDYGLRYEEQCWAITLAYLDLRGRNEFSFMIDLKGLGATQSRKFKDLF